MSITSTELCLLAGIFPDRFETALRRGKLDNFFDPIEAKGSWARYEFPDLLNLAAVVLLTESGMTFDAATEMVSNNAVGHAFAGHVSDRPLVIVAYRHGIEDPSRGHLRGTMGEVIERLPLGAAVLHILDITALSTAVILRAAQHGFRVENNSISRAKT